MREAYKSMKWAFDMSRPFALKLLLILALSALIPLCGVGLAIASKNMIDSAINGSGQLTNRIVILAVIIISDIVMQTIQDIISTKTLEELSNNIRLKVYVRLLKANWLQLSRYHSGDILTRLTSDVNAVTNIVVYQIPEVVGLCVRITAAFFTLLVFDPKLALFVLILGPGFITFARLFARKYKFLYRKVQQLEGMYRSNLQESLQNIVVIKSFCMEDKNLNNVDKLQNERLGWVVKRGKIGAYSGAILSFGYWLGYILAFLWGVSKLAKGTTTFGTVTAFIQLVNQIQGPFAGLTYAVPRLIGAITSISRIAEVENIELDEGENEETQIDKAGLQIENLCFYYEESKKIYNNVSLDIKPGEIAAFIGCSGEGKTTLIRLLLSLVKPVKGNLYITADNVKIAISPACRRFISYVPQGNTLFSGTIKDNLLCGYLKASEQEINRALNIACAADFITKLPEGINSMIGESGNGLSEGQAQRIAIARALLRPAPLLILDEATSALDADTEKSILIKLRYMNPARTCIIITHRQAVLGICDRVFKVEDKNIKEINNGSETLANEDTLAGTAACLD